MRYRQSIENHDNKPTRYYSARQENAVAKAIGGRKTSNSGATPYDKGDVTDNKWLIECKTCVKEQESFSIKKDWFKKNLEESIFMKKEYSAVVFNFGPTSKNYYIIDENTFLDMKNALENNIDRKSDV